MKEVVQVWGLAMGSLAISGLFSLLIALVFLAL
jgi:hypothetical protein